MALLDDLYMMASVGGFLYLVGTAAMGFMHTDSGGGDAGGDAPGDAGGIDAGSDGGGADAGDFGDAGSIDATNVKHLRAGALAEARAGSMKQRKTNIGLLLLKITSPYTVASFSFFFGIAGLVGTKYSALPQFVIVILATLCGVIGYNVTTNAMNSVADRLYASGSFKEEDLIGTVAEVTLPLTAGRTGEIIYLRGQTRHTAPARIKADSSEISKNSKVIITDIVDGVFVVESCNDPVLNDSVMITDQKLRNS